MFTDSFLEKLVQFEDNKNKLTAGYWMTANPLALRMNHTVREAGQLFAIEPLDAIPVIDENRRPCGIVTAQQVISGLLGGADQPVSAIAETAAVIKETARLADLVHQQTERYTVTSADGKLCGILTSADIMKGINALLKTYAENEKTSDILQVILEKAYEGIAVVDEHGIIIEFNEAYSKFTGVPRASAIGRHVTSVIDNTNLHETVRKGIPERGVLQTIQGQDMIVHRIPIWKKGKVAGAIGMLIFEGVSDIYRIYERLQQAHTETAEVNQLAQFNQITGSSKLIADAKRIARTAAQTSAAILLAGEHGTEKNAFAESIHQLSHFAAAPFSALSCAAAEEAGLQRAFSSGGTLFLQHIDQLAPALQQRLVQLLRDAQTDSVRLILSSEQPLLELAEAGRFSSELYSELNPLQIVIPPLRERKEDIPFLLSHTLQEISFSEKTPKKTFSPAAVSYLLHYSWPGNVDELAAVVRKAAGQTQDAVISQENLPDEITEQTDETTLDYVREKQDAEEKRLIEELLEKTAGNKSKTAELLGIHRTTLYKKMKKYNILT